MKRLREGGYGLRAVRGKLPIFTIYFAPSRPVQVFAWTPICKHPSVSAYRRAGSAGRRELHQPSRHPGVAEEYLKCGWCHVAVASENAPHLLRLWPEPSGAGALSSARDFKGTNFSCSPQTCAARRTRTEPQQGIHPQARYTLRLFPLFPLPFHQRHTTIPPGTPDNPGKKGLFAKTSFFLVHDQLIRRIFVCSKGGSLTTPTTRCLPKPVTDVSIGPPKFIRATAAPDESQQKTNLYNSIRQVSFYPTVATTPPRKKSIAGSVRTVLGGDAQASRQCPGRGAARGERRRSSEATIRIRREERLY